VREAVVDGVENLRQVLAQTPAVEQQQEAERRRGAREQQQVGRRLADRVDLQGHQVGEAPAADPVRNDVDEQSAGLGKEQREAPEPPATGEPGELEEDVPEPSAEVGGRLDRRA
jgi:hypothetical protein